MHYSKIASSREHANTLNIIDEISNDCTEVYLIQ